MNQKSKETTIRPVLRRIKDAVGHLLPRQKQEVDEWNVRVVKRGGVWENDAVDLAIKENSGRVVIDEVEIN